MTDQTRGSVAFTFKDHTDTAHALAEAEHLALLRARRVPTTPADLGRRAVRGYRVTPAVALVSAEVDRAIRTPDDRIIICMPPRESKSTTAAVLGCVEALRRNPNSRHILASYADTLAQAHSAGDHRRARRPVGTVPISGEILGRPLGTRRPRGRTARGRHVERHHRIRRDRPPRRGRRAQELARGRLAGVAAQGRSRIPRNPDDSRSPRRLGGRHRHPLAPRGLDWHPPRRGTRPLALVNIPAIGEPGAVPDSLGRAAGEAMVSAVGRTTQDFADQRRAVGERTWWAEFQGVPASPEGNVIRREWLDLWRLPALPAGLVRTVIGVDPCDSGEGDAAGIVAASLTTSGTVVVHRDVSEPMTPERWATVAVELAIDSGASEIVIETFTAREGYLSVLNTALRRYRLPHLVRVSSWPPKRSDRGRGDAMARSAKLIQGLETGTVRLAGHLPSLEAQAVLWQGGQHQPDCLAALTVAHDVLVHGAGRVTIVSPLDVERRMRQGAVPQPPAWMTRRIGGRRRTWRDLFTGDIV
jgi:hypothetical protein